MQRFLLGSTAIVACTLLGLSAFQTPAPKQDPPKQEPPKPKPEEPPDERLRLRNIKEPLRISGVPGADKEKSAKQFEPVTKWLSKELGRPVEFTPVADYAEAIAGFSTNKLDMVLLGGVAELRAEEQTKPLGCQTILAREEDLHLTSYLIANKKQVGEGKLPAVAERTPMSLESLAALKAKLAGLSFTFGDKTSIAGHLMPRYFLERNEVALDPETGFKSKPAYASGGDAAVIASVASGASDLGFVSAAAWESAKDEQKSAAPVVYVTPEYSDATIVIHHRTGPAMPVRIMKAFLLLDPKNPDQKAVLDAFGTKKFAPASPQLADNLRAVLKSAKERHLLE